MARWSRETTFDDIITAEAGAQGVPPELVKAVIGQESAFVPTAKRVEPKINDASYGLMQVLYRTAQTLGYTGTPDGLLDPAANIHFGTMLLAQNLNTTNGDIPRAVSAYNGGFRRDLGFGWPLPNGQFRNQDYVNRVLANLKYFRAQAAAPPSATAGGGAAAGAATASAISGSASKYGLIAAAIIAALWLLRKLTGNG